MPETTEPTVQADVTATPEISGQPVIAPDREAVIKKYETAYYGTATDATAPIVTDPASVTTEPASTQPELTTMLQSLVTEVAQLKAQLVPAAKVEPTVAATEEDWLALLASGKKSEGELALAKVLGPRIQEEAVQQALGRIQMEREVNEFATEIRSKNADLMPMESYIANAVSLKLQAAYAAGEIKSPADHVTVYKKAVNAEIENARKLTQQLRGAGKQEATSRLQEVVSNQTVKPNTVNTDRDGSTQQVTPEVDPLTDYFAKRREQYARNSGMVAQTGR